MVNFSEVIQFGMSPGMLFQRAYMDDLYLRTAYERCCALPEYDVMESYLPDDASLRKEILDLLKRTGKGLNYNTPGYFQVDGPFNLCSDDPANRKNAFEQMVRHIDHAGEAGCPRLVVTGCEDPGDEKRPELIRRYSEVFLQLCEIARKYSIRMLLEPIERHRFKKLLWGPTKECVDFIREMRKQGAENAGLMLDIAHLPLMEESLEQAIKDYAEIGFELVHMGTAVLEEWSPFYGHTHPPLEVRGALFGQKDLEDQFEQLIRCGYIGKNKARAPISLEVSPYPGTSGETSIRMMYEKCTAAFNAVQERTGLL